MASPAQASATLAGAVTDKLRRAILLGEIEPGARIRIRDVAGQMGVSPIPVREALRTLEGEELVQNLPQRGAVVTKLSLDTLAQIYDLRVIIERAVAARAATRYSVADIEAISRAQKRFATAAAKGRPTLEFGERHRDLHWAILDPGTTDLIRDTLERLWQSSGRYMNLALRVSGTMHESVHRHDHLVTAARTRDAMALSSAVVEHLVTTEAIVGHCYQTHQGDSGR